jgi:hypothetical protein
LYDRTRLKDDLVDMPDERVLTADLPVALAPADVPVAGLMDSKRASSWFAEFVVPVSVFASALSIEAFSIETFSALSMLLEVSGRPRALLVASFAAAPSLAIFR